MESTMQETLMKVGDLAERTGVTVRTLHHYEAIGLLVPSHRTDAGHRLYAGADVERLHRIRALQSLGLSLDEVRRCLDSPGFTLRRVVGMQIERLDEEMALSRRLRDRLGGIARALDASETVSVDELMRTMDMMDRIEKYYTPEQLEQLEERRRAVGEERIAQVHAEWGELIGLVRAEMEKGSDPSSPEVQELARRWQGLVEEFTGGDPAIARSVASLYEKEPDLHTSFANVPDQEMMRFVARAVTAAKKE
ncbi:MAG TPA: MerR family transcriptional regulator [Candidatus Saccharimonadales bacterium]|nr:MerR family transcriptional regulator [Candidatus Saccharimonadales bacterium]